MKDIFFRAAIPVVATLLLVGCGSPEEKAADYLVRAEAYLEEGDVRRAHLETRNALQIEPRNVEARKLMARISEAEDKPVAAMASLAIVIDEDKEDVPSRARLATLLIGAGDLESARELAEEMSRLDPDSLELLKVNARIALREGRSGDALALLATILEQEPRDVEAALIRGVTMLPVEPERAYDELSAAIERVGGDEARPLRQARVDVLNVLGRDEEAALELDQLLADYPTDEKIMANAVKFYVNRKDPQKAEKVLRAAIDAAPESMEAKYALVQFQSRTLGDLERAEETVQKFLVEEPDNAELQVVLATYYQGADRIDEAAEIYRSILAREGSASEGDSFSDAAIAASNQLALIRAGRGDVDGTLEQVEETLAMDPANGVALQVRGEIALRRGNFREARADLRASVRGDPTNELALLLLAETLEGLGDSVLAADAYRQILELQPTSAEVLGRLAVLQQRQGLLDEAEATFNRLLSVDSESLVGRSGLVEVGLAQGDLAVAEANAVAMQLLDDPGGIGQIQLGKVRQAQDELVAAVDNFRLALQKNPSSLVALRGAAGSLTLLQDLDAAGSIIENFISDNPDSAEAKTLLAGNLIRRGSLDEARDMLEALLAEDPERVQTYVVLAGSYPNDPGARAEVYSRGLAALPGQQTLGALYGAELRQLGRIDEAVEVYEGLVASNPANQQAANSLASILLEFRKDAASYRRALELSQGFVDSRNPAWLDTLGWAHFRNGNPQRAAQVLEVALAVGGTQPIIHYHLASAYAASGDAAGAERELEKFLGMLAADDPAKEVATERVRELLDEAKETNETAEAA